MSSKYDNPFSNLKRIFHEPNRLAILSALCSTANGLTFRDLRDQCDLTDGNLSRHLKALEEAGVIEIEKKFVGVKPQNTVLLTDMGRDSFIEYLKALEEVLQKAAEAITTGEEGVSLPFAWIKPLGASS